MVSRVIKVGGRTAEVCESEDKVSTMFCRHFSKDSKQRLEVIYLNRQSVERIRRLVVDAHSRKSAACRRCLW